MGWVGRSSLQTCRKKDEVAAHRLPSEGGKGNGEKEQDLGSKDVCNPTEFSKLHPKKDIPSLFSRTSVHMVDTSKTTQTSGQMGLCISEFEESSQPG